MKSIEEEKGYKNHKIQLIQQLETLSQDHQ